MSLNFLPESRALVHAGDGLESPLATVPAIAFPQSAEEGANALKLACSVERTTILGVAQVFHAIKSNLGYGEWERMWKLKLKSQRPPRSKRTSNKYALVGQEFGSADGKGPSHLVNFLPAHLDALYFLAQLGSTLVFELIADGAVYESMTAAKARELRDQYRPDLAKKREFDLARWFARLKRLLAQLDDEATPQDRQAVLPQVRQRFDQCMAKVERTQT